MMDVDRFWDLVDEARRGAGDDDERFLERLNDALMELSGEEILGFRAALNEVLREAYRWDLWGAAYVIKGGCSDDGFEYFRGWIVSRGRRAFHRALRDPETLAEIIPPDPDWDAELEEFLYLPVYVYEQRTGEEVPLPEPLPPVEEPEGERFDHDKVDELFPKLSAKMRARLH